jgi:tryptophanyl-tRNA synthetase
MMAMARAPLAAKRSVAVSATNTSPFRGASALAARGARRPFASTRLAHTGKSGVVANASPATTETSAVTAEPKTERRKRVLSGVQPTGSIHLGNYFGAIKNWVGMQEEFDAFYCVVDLHAITPGNHDPLALKASTRSSAAIYLAAGLDPEKSNVFVQSHVKAHSELCWLLNCATPIGWLEKMIQFKEKSRKAGEEVSVGLLDYPVLMAADILLYNADVVPVGEDQRQHLELTRDIAGRVNALYGGNKWKKMGPKKGDNRAPSGRFRGGDILRVPEAYIPEAGARVMSLTDGRSKMSKSNPAEGSRVNVLDTPEEIMKKIKRCKTDTFEGLELDNPERPESTNLVTVYQLCTGLSRDEVIAECGNMRWGDFKPALTEAVINHLAPIQTKYYDIMEEPGYLDGVLARGADAANEVAEKTVADVRDAMGFMERVAR